MDEYLICPLSFGLEDDGRPNAEARTRCDRAVAIAKKLAGQKERVAFVVGGGWEEFSQAHGVSSFAAAYAEYIRSEHSWSGEVLNLSLPHRTNSVDEIIALRRGVRQRQRALRFAGGYLEFFPVAVTSWWHAPRVWLIGLLVFGYPISIRASKTTLSWRITLRELFFHELPGLFKSSREAWKKHNV